MNILKGLSVKVITLLLLVCLLVACTDKPTQPPPASPTPVQTSAAGITGGTFQTNTTPAPTNETYALLPTSTPPSNSSPQSSIVPPTRFPTATPRPGQTIPELKPSLTLLRTTKVSFQTAYTKAVARMNNVNSAAKLVLAQSNSFTLEQTVWIFSFTMSGGKPRSWTIIYDSGNPADKEKKEQVNLLERGTPLLPDDAGQLDPTKVLDSDEISTRLERGGLPPDLPIDTIYLQLFPANQPSKVPAYILVNGALNKQIIVNALTGAIIQNDFL